MAATSWAAELELTDKRMRASPKIECVTNHMNEYRLLVACNNRDIIVLPGGGEYGEGTRQIFLLYR